MLGISKVAYHRMENDEFGSGEVCQQHDRAPPKKKNIQFHTRPL